ncbi:MAG: hypothetical protein IJ077_08360 [Eubacterium sp.]|nr:hypothetical protein [Eubacterium sp.]
MGKYGVNIAYAARKLGTHPNTIYKRIKDLGWSVEKATTEPLRQWKCDSKVIDTENYTNVGGWRIIYINHVKKGEYRFQAYNTDGRSYKTNDAIEIQCALEEIFANVCK